MIAQFNIYVGIQGVINAAGENPDLVGDLEHAFLSGVTEMFAPTQ